MHTVQLNINDSIFDTVMNFLKLLPKNQLNIELKDSQTNKEDYLDFGQFNVEAYKDQTPSVSSQLKQFETLVSRSNNKKQVTMELATNIDGMMDDIL